MKFHFDFPFFWLDEREMSQSAYIKDKMNSELYSILRSRCSLSDGDLFRRWQGVTAKLSKTETRAKYESVYKNYLLWLHAVCGVVLRPCVTVISVAQRLAS